MISVAICSSLGLSLDADLFIGAYCMDVILYVQSPSGGLDGTYIWSCVILIVTNRETNLTLNGPVVNTSQIPA